MARWPRNAVAVLGLMTAGMLATVPHRACADGLVVAPKEYKGSLEERAQEAIVIFYTGHDGQKATEDLILKIRVEGEAAKFAWVVPLPGEPVTAPEKSELFEELHRYVQFRLSSRHKFEKSAAAPGAASEPAGVNQAPVEVLSRKDVGSYDVAVVRENQEGALNHWLEENGYRPLKAAEDVIGFYRRKGYVFACIKVRDAEFAGGSPVALHPLRFSFSTGGIDGIYFPMRLTGLQAQPFDINLYVFYNKWLNDRVSPFGYEHRGFVRNWRDFDSRDCVPNAGKHWSNPGADPFLKIAAGMIPTVAKLFQKLHPGERYYLTNIQALGLNPAEVRDWSDDLWLFPYYTDPKMVPFDARPGGPAAGAYPHAVVNDSPGAAHSVFRAPWRWTIGLSGLLVAAGLVAAWRLLPLRGRSQKGGPPHLD